MTDVSNNITTVEPFTKLGISDFKELLEYRDLFFFLVWRDIKVLYAQTILGFAWAILQPLFQIIIFSIIFGKVAQLSTDNIPYFLFSTVAIIPWTYMSTAMAQSSESLVSNQNMLGKIYFPRLMFPITPILSKLLDLSISLVLLVPVFIYYEVVPGWGFLYLPIFFLMMISIPLSVGLWLSALAIRYRDVRFVMQFALRMLVYSAPIVYSAASIPETYRIVYSLNPLVGVIEGFRASLLGLPVPWEFIYPGMLTCTLLLVSGAFYFKKMERLFVDVI